MVSEACQVVGTPGDIILADAKGILAATRPGEVREDLSLHVFFDLDMSAFRFTMRLGAVPWWAACDGPGREIARGSAKVIAVGSAKVIAWRTALGALEEPA